MAPAPTAELIKTDTLPGTLALSPDKRLLAVLNAGWGSAAALNRQTIALYDVSGPEMKKLADSLSAPEQAYFLGLAFGSGGDRLYASVVSTHKDDGNGIAVFRVENGALIFDHLITIPLLRLPRGTQGNLVGENRDVRRQYSFPAGMAVMASAEGDRILVAANLADCALLIDARSGRVMRQFDLHTAKHVPSAYPFTAVASRDGKRGYVSLWNDSSVAEIDLVSGKVHKIALQPPRDPSDPGSHPTAMVLSADEGSLYVTLGNSDEVAEIDTGSGEVRRYFSTRLPGQSFLGAVPSALTLSPDGKSLFVANAGADNIAWFDLSSGANTAKGFLPTQWWPQALVARGDELLVLSSRGTGTGPKLVQVNPLSLLNGSLAKYDYLRIDLAEATHDAEQAFAPEGAQKLPASAAAIKHVIYVLKENRSYDQVFGDLGVGNGDASLTLFGEQITPNQHELAHEFGVYDDFYDSGEVSGQGHVWSTAATATDYLERTLELAYHPRERTYDFDGVVAKRVPLDDDIADVNEPSTRYLWSDVAAHGLTYRHYGEYISTTWCYDPRRELEPFPRGVKCARNEIKKGEPLPAGLGLPPGGASPWHNVELFANNIATKPELRGHFDPKFPDFNLAYPDQLRADEFLREFASFAAARAKNDQAHELPNYILLRLPDDHTSGTKPGLPSPEAAVADNDLAVGRVVEAVSHSDYWRDTAIVVIEDDAQSGADHVDAHRSLALLISAYSPSSAQKPMVDSSFYTTVSALRTMEALLGLPPMNANDARVPLMVSAFTGDGQHAPFTADYRNRENGMIYRVNSDSAPGAAASARMDFTHADAVDTQALNTILWHAMKGVSSSPPVMSSH